MGIEPFLISSVLLVSFAQRLVHGMSLLQGVISRRKGLSFGITAEKARNAKFSARQGCYQCKNTGYKGRTGLFEVLANDEMVQDMILKRKSSQEIARAALETGRLRTLKEDAAQKVMRGITTLEGSRLPL